MPKEINIDNLCEIFGIYFSNCYYNILYKTSIDSWREEIFETKEEAYKTTIERYVKAICVKDEKTEKVNKHYLKVLQDLFHNYRTFLESSETYLTFIDNCSKFILPRDYYKTLSSNDSKKDTILKNILTKTLTKYTISIIKSDISNIINENRRKSNIDIIQLKKRFIDIFIDEKNEFCSYLLAKNIGVNINDKDNIPQIPKEVCDRLQQKIKELIYEKSQILHERNELAREVERLRKIIKSTKSISSSESSDSETSTSSEYKKKRLSRFHRSKHSQHKKTENLEKHKKTENLEKLKKQENLEKKEISNEALEQLKNEEYSDDDVKSLNKIDEIELPDGDLQADD